MCAFQAQGDTVFGLPYESGPKKMIVAGITAMHMHDDC